MLIQVGHIRDIGCLRYKIFKLHHEAYVAYFVGLSVGPVGPSKKMFYINILKGNKIANIYLIVDKKLDKFQNDPDKALYIKEALMTEDIPMNIAVYVKCFLIFLVFLFSYKFSMMTYAIGNLYTSNLFTYCS